MNLSKKAGNIISLDLASFNVVDENLAFLKDIISKYVDIVFANEEEARSFTHEEPKKAVNDLSKYCKIAIVKIGKEGSLIQEGKKLVKVTSTNVTVRDTTGAGDLYAAGYLYGYLKGFDLELCGKIGSLLGGEVIQVYGARLKENSWREIRGKINHLTIE